MSTRTQPYDFEHSPNTMLVGLAGTLIAGKDTAAEHLAEKHGFMHVSTGDVLRAEASKYGLKPDRNTLIDIGIRLTQEHGSPGALAAMAIEKWERQRESYMGGIVVSGLRPIGQGQEIIDRHGKLIFMDAPLESRYQRMVARKRDTEVTQSLEEFAAQDALEFEGVPDDPSRPNLRALKEMSHTVIFNGSMGTELLFSNLDRAVGVADF